MGVMGEVVVGVGVLVDHLLGHLHLQENAGEWNDHGENAARCKRTSRCNANVHALIAPILPVQQPVCEVGRARDAVLEHP